MASVPGQGTEIPRAAGPKSQNIKQKQYCNKFNKDFKTLKSHLKKKIVDENSQSGLQAYSIGLFVKFMDNKLIYHPDFL